MWSDDDGHERYEQILGTLEQEVSFSVGEIKESFMEKMVFELGI